MRILFLDQSGKIGGAELCLADVAACYRHDRSLVGLFAEGEFRDLLEQQQISVQVLTNHAISVRKNSSFLTGLSGFASLLPLIRQVAKLSRDFDLIYANTQKALVVGAIASFLSQRPFVYHLHDILSAEHFSATNRRLIVSLANRAAIVIANSQASQAAFVAAGGRESSTHVVYNGFAPERYDSGAIDRAAVRQRLGVGDRFVVGHFSRLSPWKGQHVLVEALRRCPDRVVVLFVGDALFGEQAYVEQLHAQVKQLGLQDRVQFLGFQADVPALMSACDLVVHSSIAAEPFGRVIVEAMLCGRPIAAAAAGGALEIVAHGETGWLTPPSDAQTLAEVIAECMNHPDRAAAIAQNGKRTAIERFNLSTINAAIDTLLAAVR